MSEIISITGWSLGPSSLSWLPGQAVSYKQLLPDPMNELQNLKPETLIGYSLGGILVLEAVLEGFVKPKRLFLLAPALKFEHEVKSLADAVKRSSKAAVRQFQGSYRLPADYSWDESSLLAGLDFLQNSDLKERARRLDCEVKLFYSEHDALISPQSSIAAAEKLQVEIIKIKSPFGHNAFCSEVPEVLQEL